MFLDQFLLKLSCIKTHTQTQKHTQRDSDEVLYNCIFQKRNYNITIIVYIDYRRAFLLHINTQAYSKAEI